MNLANRITLVRVILIPIFLVVLLGEMPDALIEPGPWAVYRPWVAAFIFIALAASDAVDGYVARSRNQVTTFGKFIDPLADKLLVTAALVALVELDKLPAWIALVIISREFIVSGLRLVAIAEGRVIAAANSGKLKTVLQIIAIVAFLIKDSETVRTIGGTVATAAQTVAWVIMAAAVLMTMLSMVQYFYHARDILTGPWESVDTKNT
jgi:CDP-diacylglycerol--glycerol-3-phosphate 3-phosphatidyltransferase